MMPKWANPLALGRVCGILCASMKNGKFKILTIASLGAALALLPSCQTTRGDGSLAAFDDYPFDEHGNYIESAARGMGTSSGRRPVSVASAPPMPPTPDPGYQAVQVSPSPPPSTASAAAPSTRPSPPPAARTHTVQRGDTLWGLSRQYNTTVRAIKDANGLSSDLIRIGQTLQIPR